MDGAAAENVTAFWHAIGIAGGLIFYGRFYVQWIASERAGRSVMPVLFWYMSSVGSVLLMIFAVVTRSPVGALGQNFNLVVYGRNLIHIWRERGTLTPFRYRAVHVSVLIVAAVAVYLVALVWWGEYEHIKAAPDHVSRRVWFWLAVGVAGQALFAARFLVQWIATETRKQSVVPAAFWYLSVAASTLQAASFLQRREWVFGVGMAATLLIYLRNIWLVRRVLPVPAEGTAP
jgi:lipid-A-disaccharide synthase-like uncharacterized protein